MTTFCTYYDRGHCRSCAWIERSYAEQIAEKEGRIRSELAFLGPPALEQPVTSPPQSFRNRAKMAVTGTVDAPVVGLTGDFRADAPLDQGRELLSCPIHDAELNKVIGFLPEFIRTTRIAPYRIDARQGELKGLILFHSPGSGEMYLRFVLRSKESIARLRKHLPELQVRFPQLLCVSANIQPVPHAVLEGPEEIILTEKAWITHRLGRIPFKLAPQAFVQTNATVATRLYETAAEWIGEAHAKKMLELYCGQGAFSFFAAGAVERALGVELNADAVRTANESAAEMGLTHLLFEASDATRPGELTDRALAFAPDLVLANPPRRGLGEAAALIDRIAPAHFIYSSCSIESMARDLKRLTARYRLRKIQLFDMFPHTEHFETLAWLDRSG